MSETLVQPQSGLLKLNRAFPGFRLSDKASNTDSKRSQNKLGLEQSALMKTRD